jgi:glutamine amidotransferase
VDKAVLDQAEKKPVLGICLGMQLLFDRGEEMRVTRDWGLSGNGQEDRTSRKLPHIGWNSLSFKMLPRC